jgi:hypothetical protein
MGIELEVSFLLTLQLIGTEIFAPFEVETPPWKKILKWSIIAALTLGLYLIIGHWSILVPTAIGLAGLTFHITWCKKNGIDPLRATPRRRYYELRGWQWPDEAHPHAGATD